MTRTSRPWYRIIFCTVVHGIGSMSDLKKIGRVGVKTLFYFEAVSTLALAIGLIVGEVIQPGKTMARPIAVGGEKEALPV